MRVMAHAAFAFIAACTRIPEWLRAADREPDIVDQACGAGTFRRPFASSSLRLLTFDFPREGRSATASITLAGPLLDALSWVVTSLVG